jgi:hypothetical protein
MTTTNAFQNDINRAKELVYDQCNLCFGNLNWNAESMEYGACSFELDGKKIEHRTSKITPAKTGQFVTLWKRNQNGITEPLDSNDPINFVIITARNDDKLGQFIFPTTVLAEKGIITQNGKSGKRGFRVYPPWDIPKSKQAEKTQNWQKNYFLTIKEGGFTDFGLANKLLTTKQ